VVGRRWAVQSLYRKPTVSRLSAAGSIIRGTDGMSMIF
jgi:hypothetical protein